MIEQKNARTKECQRKTITIDAETHKKLRVESAKTGKKIKDIVRELVEELTQM